MSEIKERRQTRPIAGAERKPPLSGGTGRVPADRMEAAPLRPGAEEEGKEFISPLIEEGSSLGRRRSEMIAALVATLNDSHY